MRQALFPALLVFSSFLFSSVAGGQCTTYVLVDVLDRSLGMGIETLKPADFEARVDKTDFPIVSAEQHAQIRVVVLVETDDIAKNTRAADAVDIVARQARQAPEGQPVAFGVYADHALFTNGFIADSNKRTREIGEVIEQENSLGKRVAMYDALHQALKLFGEHQPGDTVILVADPYDDKSSHSAGDVEKEFLATGTRLLIMLRQPLSRASRDFNWNPHSREKQMFSQLPDRTGGAYSDFDPHFFGWAWKGYMLGVKLPEGTQKPRKWKMHLQGEAGTAFRKAMLFYPEQLPPCHVSAAGVQTSTTEARRH